MRTAIFTAATGHGHLSAARALAEVAQGRGDALEIVDVGAAHPLLGALVASYNVWLRRPPRWMTLFFGAVNAVRLDRLAYRLVRPWAMRELRRIRPDAILSVHPMVNFGIAETLWELSMDVPFAVVLTDLAPPFWRGWAERRAAAITAPTPEAADQLAAWGVPRERIRPAPIPIRPVLRKPMSAARRGEVLRTLGLEAHRLTVALSAGRARRPSALRAYKALAAAPDLASRIQTVILTGGNSHMLERARRVDPPFPSAVLAWRDDPETILAAADALFTKPGGLMASEALAAGATLLLDAVGGVMPQERGTVRWVVAREAGWIVEAPEDVPAILRRVASGDWQGSRERATQAVGGDAATVLDLLEDALRAPGIQGAGRSHPAHALVSAAVAAPAEKGRRA